MIKANRKVESKIIYVVNEKIELVGINVIVKDDVIKRSSRMSPAEKYSKSIIKKLGQKYNVPVSVRFN